MMMIDNIEEKSLITKITKTYSVERERENHHKNDKMITAYTQTQTPQDLRSTSCCCCWFDWFRNPQIDKKNSRIIFILQVNSKILCSIQSTSIPLFSLVFCFGVFFSKWEIYYLLFCFYSQWFWSIFDSWIQQNSRLFFSFDRCVNFD